MTPDLRATLEEQRRATDELQRKTGSVIPWVFHRTKRRPLKGFRKAWQRRAPRLACRGASFTTSGEPR
jgi:hypothetical protein